MTGLRRAARSLGLLIVLVLLAGCGLSEHAAPQPIAPENLPPDLLDPNPGSSTTLPESAGTTSVTVYYLMQDGDGERLAEVEREVTDADDPSERIGVVLSVPTEDEAQDGLTTSIPADTFLIDTEFNAEDDELVVDLSDELFSIQGEEQAKAFAQIVYTVSEIEGIRQVRFLVDGEEIRARTAEGVETDGPVTRADYRSLAPVR